MVNLYCYKINNSVEQQHSGGQGLGTDSHPHKTGLAKTSYTIVHPYGDDVWSARRFFQN
jgi:hypothetical protein